MLKALLDDRSTAKARVGTAIRVLRRARLLWDNSSRSQF
jgi:hypothetical protein